MNLFQLATRGVDLSKLPDEEAPRQSVAFEPSTSGGKFSVPSDLNDAFEFAAKDFGIDPDVLRAVAYAESRFHPDVVSGKVKSKTGATGLMQFMPATAKEYGIDPLDPVQSIFGAAAYLRKSLDRFDGNYGKAVASYNAGPNRKDFDAEDWDARMPAETQGYLRTVFTAADQLKSGKAERPLPAGVEPSKAGAGRGVVNPGMVNTQETQAVEPPAPKAAPSTDRTWGEVASDTTKSVAQGLLDVASLPGAAYSAATGNWNTDYMNAIRGTQEVLQEQKSPGIQAQQKALQKKLETAEGWREKFAVGGIETITNPALLADTLARSAPGMLAGGLAGRAAGAGANALGNAAIGRTIATGSEAAARVALVAKNGAGAIARGVATGTAASQQGVSVANEVYGELSKLPPEAFSSEPEYAELAKQFGPEQAKEVLASAAANRALLMATGASVLSMKLVPGGSAIETMFLPKTLKGEAAKAVASTSMLTKPIGQGMTGGVVSKTVEMMVQGAKTGGAESFSEGFEEATGAGAKGLELSRAGKDVNLGEMMGEAGGQGAAAGLVIGKIAGMQEAYQAPRVESQPTTPTAPQVTPSNGVYPKPVDGVYPNSTATQAVDNIAALLKQTEANIDGTATQATPVQPGSQAVDAGAAPVAQGPADTGGGLAAAGTAAATGQSESAQSLSQIRQKQEQVRAAMQGAVSPLPADKASTPTGIGADNASMESLIKEKQPKPAATGLAAEMAALKARSNKPRQNKAPKPLLTDGERDMLADFERMYQADVKGEIKTRLGLMPARQDEATAPAEKRKPSELLAAIKRAGGIKSTNAADLMGGSAMDANRILPSLFKKDGMNLDLLVPFLKERGYLTQADEDSIKDNGGVNKLAEILQAELSGDRAQTVDSTAGYEADADKAMRSELDDKAFALGLPMKVTNEMSTERLNGVINRIERKLGKPVNTDFATRKMSRTEAMAERQAILMADRVERARAQYDADIQAFAEANDRVQERVLDVMTDEDGNIEVIYESTAGEAYDEGRDTREDSGEVGRPVAQGARAGAGNPEANRTEAGAGQEGLTSYTPAEVTTRQNAAKEAEATAKRAEAAAARAEAAAKQASEIAQRSVAAADTFELGGNAEDNLSGQEGLRFSRKAKSEADERNLIIQHNLTADNLLHAVKMGGIAVPSLAVTTKTEPLTGFGEITLIGSVSMADPKGYAGTKVFGADIYSPRYPSVTFEFTPNMRKRGEAMLKEGMTATDSRYLDWSEVERDGARELERQTSVLWQFLKSKGVEPAITRTQPKPLADRIMPFKDDTRMAHELADDPAFADAVYQTHQDMLTNAYGGDEEAAQMASEEIAKMKATAAERGRSRLVNGYAQGVAEYQRNARQAGQIDRDATRRALQSQVREAHLDVELRDYAAAIVTDLNPNERIFQGFTNSGNRKYIPHTLENVVKLLKKELRGGESFNYGVGSLRAKFTPQFKSVADIRKNKDRLISSADFDKIKDEINTEFLNMAEAMSIKSETLSAIMEDAAKMGVTRAAAEYGADVGGNRAVEIAEFMTRLRNLPTAYFEAKILRDVDLAEFAAAVIPIDASPKVRTALESRGVTNVFTYERNNEADRKRAIQEAAESKDDLVFSKSTEAPRTPASTIRTAITKAYGNLLTRLEGKGLVSLTQTEEEAIASAAQARADQNGGDVEAIKAQLRKSVLSSQRGTTMGMPETQAPGPQGDAQQGAVQGSAVIEAVKKRTAIRDDAGKPLRLYHGSEQLFTEFDIEEDQRGVGGIWLTDSKNYAYDMSRGGWDSRKRGAGGQIVHAYLDVVNPLEFDVLAEGKTVANDIGADQPSDSLEAQELLSGSDGWDYFVSGLVSDAKRAGHDALVIKNFNDARMVDSTAYVVFDQNKIAIEKIELNEQSTPTSQGVDIRRSADGNLEGFFDPATGKSYLIADNLTAESAPGTLMHEVGIHMAADGKLEPLFIRAGNLLKLARNNPFIQRVQSRMDEAGETSNEEAAAYIVTEYEKDRTNAPASVGKWVKDFIADVRAWLFAKGVLLKADQLTVADIAAVARANANRMAKGDAKGDVRYSKAAPTDQTQTAAFKRWFGDSKVVDADGKPLVVMHGTPNDQFFEFDPDRVGDNNYGSSGSGFWFTDDYSQARRYWDPRGRNPAKPNIMEVYLKAVNPLVADPAAEAEAIALDQGIDDFDSSDWDQVSELLKYAEWAQDKVKEAMHNGHDSLLIKQSGDAPGNTGSGDHWVVFDPTQIKSATGNNGNFDPANPDIRFSRGAGSKQDQQNLALNDPSSPAWMLPASTKTDALVYELQDQKVDLKRTQEAIKEAGRAITEPFDARMAETLMPGRVAYRTETFLKTEVAPLMEAMAKNNVTQNELSDYLLARHAPERNAQIAKVNPEMPDGGAGTNSQGVLMTTQAAQDHIAALTTGKRMVLQLLANKIDAITASTRDLLVREGLEKQSTMDAWTGAYKHYVPLFKDEAVESPAHPIGSGMSVTGSASKRAMGSEGEVTNMVAHILMQREAAITRAEKNRVAMSLYGLALSNPNKDVWSTIRPSMSADKIGAELAAMGVDPVEAEQGMHGVPTIRTINSVTGLVQETPNPMYKRLENALVVKVDGEDRVILFNAKNADAMRMARALKNQDGLTNFDLAGSMVGAATRYLASINTQYNPAFGMVNVVRDIGGALVNLTTTGIADQKAKVLGDIPAAMKGIARDVRGDQARTPWSDLWVQFQEDGGRTGYRDLFIDPFKRAEAVQKDLDAMQRDGTASAGRVAHSILDLLDDFNTTLENGVRLSAYKAALDKGMSRPAAAKMARELTVDFNRKGRTGREVGPLYAFFNASVQGTARTIESLKGPAGKKIIAGGLMLGVIQSLMLAAAGFDDDEPPEFVKARAFIIPMGDRRYIAIPLQFGLNALPNTGRVITDLLLTGGKDAGKKTFNAIGEIMGSFNPLGGGNIFTAHGLLTTVAPTVADPLVDLATNTNFAGTPIGKDRADWDTRPGAKLARESTQRSLAGQAYIGISKAINAMSGGNEFKKGLASPTPEQVQYVFTTAGGGLYRELEKTLNIAGLKADGMDIKPRMIPLGGRFAGEADDQDTQRSRYYRNSERLAALEAELKGFEKDGNGSAVNRIEAERSDEVDLLGDYKHIRQAITKLNKLAADNINDVEMLKELDAERLELMRELNDSVRKLEKRSELFKRD